MTHTPFFYDTTLRDGNQALKKPWNIEEKTTIFNQLLSLGVQAVEVGFPAADEMDFDACQKLAKMSPDNVVISVLARCVKSDIDKALEAVQAAKHPRIHTFIAMNPLGLEYVLKKEIETVTQTAVDMVGYIKQQSPNTEVEFSVEHFGDCRENLPAVVAAIEKVVAAGADVINLPNTVERFRPLEFVNMVRAVYDKIGDKATISVHCHNDLGMATATSVESYYAGATQIETTLNGLGERAGNTNMYEVAVALYNMNEPVPLNMQKFYESSQMVAQMSDIPVAEKAPIIGSDVLSHRSGIHQDGANKTKGLSKGQYIAYDPALVGRDEGEHLGFTSQSGKSALFSIYQSMGYPLTMKEVESIMPIAKKQAESIGELTPKHLDAIYRENICQTKGPYQFVNCVKKTKSRHEISFTKDGHDKRITGKGRGPIEACVSALYALGVVISVEDYKQGMLNRTDKESAESVSQFTMRQGAKEVVARALDRSTTRANMVALFNGLNLLLEK